MSKSPPVRTVFFMCLLFAASSCSDPVRGINDARDNGPSIRLSGGGIGGTKILAALRQDGVTEESGVRFGSCMGTEAFESGLTAGMKNEADLNCNSSDVAISDAQVLSYSFDGTTFFPVSAGPIECTEGSPIFFQMSLGLVENSNSPRTDVGLWVASDGGNAITGTCEQYTFFVSGADGIADLDGDQCGDMLTDTRIVLPLGVVGSTCTGTSVHVGTCIGWTQPGQDRVCPTAGDNNFRIGAVPANKSKCNCQGFDVPITVL